MACGKDTPAPLKCFSCWAVAAGVCGCVGLLPRRARVRAKPQDYACINCDRRVADHVTVFETEAAREAAGRPVREAFFPLAETPELQGLEDAVDLGRPRGAARADEAQRRGEVQRLPGREPAVQQLRAVLRRERDRAPSGAPLRASRPARRSRSPRRRAAARSGPPTASTCRSRSAP